MKKPVLIKEDIPEEIFNDFSNRTELSLDCEMMGLNPHRDRLCVIQIAAENGTCILMQIDEKLKYTNLKLLLENEKVQKIFHFARMDCLFIKARLKINVKNIFCTKIASKVGRTFTDRHGLKELVRVIIGEAMDKGQQTSDWGRETLTSDQLHYAALDVKYLFAIKREMLNILSRENRLSLVEEAIRFLPTLVELDRLGYENIFDH